jgi:hypothetical protein
MDGDLKIELEDAISILQILSGIKGNTSCHQSITLSDLIFVLKLLVDNE